VGLIENRLQFNQISIGTKWRKKEDHFDKKSTKQDVTIVDTLAILIESNFDSAKKHFHNFCKQIVAGGSLWKCEIL
jgi:archaellum biogenesis ATPase FlaH